MPASALSASPHILREYAFVADGERGALIGPTGGVSWLCVPRWDSGSVFGALLGAPGSYEIRPTGTFVWGGRYEPGSLIWRNRWTTTDGIVECREALAFPGEQSRAVLLRRLEGGDVDVEVHVSLDVRADYGASPLSDLHRDDRGVWTARAGGLRVRWSGGGAADVVDRDGGPVLEMDLVVRAGEHHDLVLEIADGELPSAPADPARTWSGTESRWARSAPALDTARGVVAPRDARHATCVLRGLTSASGGMVAAATTSLPERFTAGENSDYRFVWVRDQCYAGQAAPAAGRVDLLDDAVRFLSARLLDDGPRLRPAYDVAGGEVPTERTLDVPGYPGGGRTVGNHGGEQLQLDAFGELLLLFATAGRHDRLDADGWRAVETAIAAVGERWTEPDAGVWELEYRHWTHSRLICAAGLRAVAGAHGGHGRTAGTAAGWEALADRIVASTSASSLHPSGRWQRADDDPRLDAALLLPALRGAVPATELRSRETLRAYLAELTVDGYAYRFRHDERPLGDAEGAFLLCNFLTALACHQRGDERTARHFFERGRSACGPPGLMSEEFDVGQRQLRGNIPQGFVHALLLECATTLDPLEGSEPHGR